MTLSLSFSLMALINKSFMANNFKAPFEFQRPPERSHEDIYDSLLFLVFLPSVGPVPLVWDYEC